MPVHDVSYYFISTGSFRKHDARSVHLTRMSN
jgi:hypothetical protein